MKTLDAVNQMLLAMGQTPVSTVVDNQHPDVISALAVLQRISKKLQSKGYWFNSDYNLTLSANPLTGEVILPSTVLSVDAVNVKSQYVQRGTRLYDAENNTFEIGTSVVVNIIQQLTFETLPEVMADYIAYAATYEFIRDKIGDTIKMQELAKSTELARRDVNAEDIKNSNISLSTNPSTLRLLSNIRPAR